MAFGWQAWCSDGIMLFGFCVLIVRIIGVNIEHAWQPFLIYIWGDISKFKISENIVSFLRSNYALTTWNQLIINF
jgi:hypothetical protein